MTLAELQADFLTMLDRSVRRFGVAEGLPPALRESVAATPRHRFVHRFRVDQGPLCDNDAEPERHWPVIYSDAVMRHVDAAGAPLPSSNSEPSYVLYLLHLLELRPGQAVLEIGSGSGWLAANMARLVGRGGRVTGVELLAELAAQSRADLAAAGLEAVEIITGDGYAGYAPAAPFDRAIITASTWSLPVALFDQVVEGGKVLVPIELRSPDGCAVTVLRREDDRFVAERAVPGWFVPLLGEGQSRTQTELPDLSAASSRTPLPLGLARPGGPAPAAAVFRAFLGRTEPGFVAAPMDRDRWGEVPPFGLRRDASWAIWRSGEVLSQGHDAAAALARAYNLWTAFGLPGFDAFGLEIYRAAAAPAPGDHLWLDRRGDTTLVWSLRPEMTVRREP